MGVIAREHEEEAWTVAYQRFPEDRKGQLAHHLAMKVSDSSWHKQMSGLSQGPKEERSPYWLTPFENHKTYCPYLVGSYDIVGQELGRYMSLGYKAFILDVPVSREDLAHTNEAFRLALEGLGQ